jgi:hypothetical protein
MRIELSDDKEPGRLRGGGDGLRAMRGKIFFSSAWS